MRGSVCSLQEKQRKKYTGIKPLPTSMKEKETHWPEEPWVSSTREKEEQVRIRRVTSRPLLQTKTLRATGFFIVVVSLCA